MDTDNKRKNIQDELTHAEYGEPDKFRPVSQKWVPVGRKKTVVSCASLTDNVKSSQIDGLIPTKVDTKSVAKEENTRVDSFVPLTRGELQCSNFSTSSSSETNKSTGNLRSDPYTDGEFASVLESNLHLSNRGDLNKTFHVINNSYNSQAMAEAVHQELGTQFERFICSTSPSICQRSHSRRCRSCFPKQLRNDSCCWHEIHNVTLGSLWQWYEEPGCYGLEVKAEEKCNSKRLHNGCLEFKAYFVPYLSAVQLFGRTGFNNAYCGADKVTKSSDLESRPILTKLLSQPCNEEDACLPGSVSSLIDRLHNQSVGIAKSNDEELIFEYFEHAQPPQRRPLFEKIKELVSGDRPSNSQIYGDPLKLECMNLHDLRPASWFSVAWYPVYRIPEGNFRAAFLTYHSLGHFLHQSASPHTAGGFTRIVSPVVGLQSYNAKECWFQPRVSNSKEAHAEVSSSNTSEILEEWLRTLEHTASVMATATVRKDNHRYANNHPDYNHFFSRW